MAMARGGYLLNSSFTQGCLNFSLTIAVIFYWSYKMVVAPPPILGILFDLQDSCSPQPPLL